MTIEEITAQRDTAEADRDDLNGQVLELKRVNATLLGEIQGMHEDAAGEDL